MKKSFVRVFYLICPMAVIAMTCKQYQATLKMENKVTNHALLKEGPSSDPGNCSLMCDHGRSLFGFNFQRKWCRVHESVDLMDKTLEEFGWRYYLFDETSTCGVNVQRNCDDYYKKGYRNSDVYDLRPFDNNSLSVKAYCIMTNEGGWTVIHRRKDNSTDFYRTWKEYKAGFGDRNGDYWIGNDAIHALTKHLDQKLRVEVRKTPQGVIYDANYSNFSIGDETSNYRLVVNGYSGTAGDGLDFHNMIPFSTKDRNNDNFSISNGGCAVYWQGAWWYKNCRHSDLNSDPMRWLFYIIESTMMITSHH